MTNTKPFHKLDLLELHHVLVNRKASMLEVTEHMLSICKQKNKDLIAVSEIWEHESIERAKSIDKLLDSGIQIPLLGAFAAVKSIFCKKDSVCDASSKILENFVPPTTSTVVERLEQHGGISISNSICDEFGMGSSGFSALHGCPRNPYDTSKTTGGSSGGSAAAVASGMANIAFGSDTGGSTRHPASICGIVGFKPSYGVLSRDGLMSLASSLDHVGLIGRKVLDIATVFGHIKGQCNKDPRSLNIEATDVNLISTPLESGLRIGTLHSWDINPHLYNHAHNILNRWAQDVGGTIKKVKPRTLESAGSAYAIINATEAVCNMNRFDGKFFGPCMDVGSYRQNAVETRSNCLTESTQLRIIRGAYFAQNKIENGDSWYKLACRARTAMIEDFNRLFKSIDILVLPCTQVPPFDIDVFTHPRKHRGHEHDLIENSEDAYTACANLTGFPGIAVPFVLDETTGLPTGLVFIGNKFHDNKLLRIAHSFEQHSSFKLFIDMEI